MGESILEDVELYKLLVKKKSPYVNNVTRIAEFAKDKLALIIKVFESYTDHGIEHSKKVMKYMHKLVKNEDLLSPEEIVIMIYAALFHDIGMALEDQELENLDKGMPINDGEKGYDFEKVKRLYKNDEIIARAQIVREHHGKRSANIIKSCINAGTIKGIDMAEAFSFTFGKYHTPFADYLALICESHEQSISWIETNINTQLNLHDNIVINGQYIACLLRLADLLDLDCDRAPQYYEWIRTVKPDSKPFFYINQMVSPDDKVFPCNEQACMSSCPNFLRCGKSKLEIRISGDYPHDNELTQQKKDEIYSKCLEYFTYVEHEIQDVLELSRKWKDRSINLRTKVSLNINKPDKLAIDVPQKLEVEYAVVRNLFLGENLYKDKKIGLRELLQNAYDACMELREIYTKNDDLYKLAHEYNPIIRIIINRSENQFIIQDNGVGMSLSTMTNCFLHVGKSTYESNKYRYTNFHRNHIGHFGIGFFAAYMLSDHVEITTTYHKDHETIIARFAKQLEHVIIVKKEPSSYIEPGTSIILALDKVMSVFGNIDNIKSYITENFIQAKIAISIDIISKSRVSKKNISLRSIGEINIIKDANIEKLDLSEYFNDVEIIAHLSGDEGYQTEVQSIREERNFMYDGTRFKEVEFDDVEKYIVSSKNQICFYKIVQAKCNLFVPEIYWKDNRAPFGFEGYTRNVNISTPGMSIYNGYSFAQFMKDHNIEFKIPGRGSIQKLNVFINDNELCFYELDKEFKKNALTLQINQACGEADKVDVVFIRNVLVPDFHIKIPVLPYDINVVNINCNIFTDNVFPTIDRQDVPLSVKKAFSYAVGKAIILAYLKRIDNPKEKRKIQKFSEKFYADTNIFLKES